MSHMRFDATTLWPFFEYNWIQTCSIASSAILFNAALHSHKSCSLLDCFAFSVWESLLAADSAQALPQV